MKLLKHEKGYHRRKSEEMRRIADEAWERGWKDVSDTFHSLARKYEKERKEYERGQD